MIKYKNKLKLDFKIDDLLKDLKVAIGILTEEGTYITYPHRSLQEYFAALFVTSLTHHSKIQFYKTLIFKIKNNDYRNIDFQNFCSLLKEMDKINYQKQLEIPLLRYLKKKLNDPFSVFELDHILSMGFVLYNINETMGFRFGLEFSNLSSTIKKNIRVRINIVMKM